VESLAIYVPCLVTTKDYFASGHRACSGCGEVLAVRLTCKALGRNVIIANATGCMEIVSSQLPYTSWEVPWIHTLFENTAAVASGIEAGIKVLRRKGGYSPKTKVVAMGGDGALWILVSKLYQVPWKEGITLSIFVTTTKLI